MPREIIITFNADGDPIIEACGFKGTNCLKDTEWLRKSLGTDKRVVKKTDYYNGVAQQPAHLKRTND